MVTFNVINVDTSNADRSKHLPDRHCPRSGRRGGGSLADTGELGGLGRSLERVGPCNRREPVSYRSLDAWLGEYEVWTGVRSVASREWRIGDVATRHRGTVRG